jgi:MFS family permease
VGTETLGSFRLAPFRWLWASGLTSGFAMFTSQLVLSWLALETTGSPLAVGTVFAARVVPQIVFGLPAGALADRLPRRRVVMAANAGSGTIVVGLSIAWLAGLVGLPVLIVGAFLVGAFDAVRITAATALVFDVVGRRSATNGIALSNLAAQVSGIVAGTIGGYGVEGLGPGPTLLLAGVAYLGSVVLVAQLSATQRVPGEASGPAVTLRRAAALLLRNRHVALIAVVVVAAEIFGFSSLTLMPSFARDVFGIGAAGLGWLVSARAVGGTLGLLAIATTTSRWRTIGTIALLAGLFGLALVLFSLTLNLAIALILAGVIGAAGGAVDAVGQAQMQHAVRPEERGSAMGAWMFCIGLGLIGHVEIGTLGARTGAQIAQGLNGAALMAVALVIGAALPVIRTRWVGMPDQSPE